MNFNQLFPWLRRKRTKCIGHVPVDAGCLLIIDPSYLRDVIFKGDAQVETWYDAAVVDKIGVAIDENWPVHGPGATAADTPIGRFVISGRGDGYYPVEAVYGDDGTLEEVRIIFSGKGA